MVYTLAAVHNFVNKFEKDNVLWDTEEDSNLEDEEDASFNEPFTQQTANLAILRERDQIAKDMWESYDRYHTLN